MQMRAVIGRLCLVATIGLVCGLAAGCETSPKKKRPPLPGEERANPLAWGRAYPGDPQPGLGAFPQSR